MKGKFVKSGFLQRKQRYKPGALLVPFSGNQGEAHAGREERREVLSSLAYF